MIKKFETRCVFVLLFKAGGVVGLYVLSCYCLICLFGIQVLPKILEVYSHCVQINELVYQSRPCVDGSIGNAIGPYGKASVEVVGSVKSVSEEYAGSHECAVGVQASDPPVCFSRHGIKRKRSFPSGLQLKYRLFYAAQDGCLDCVRHSIEDLGVAVDSKSLNRGYTALDFATWASHQAVIKYLECCQGSHTGADVDGPSDGRSSEQSLYSCKARKIMRDMGWHEGQGLGKEIGRAHV